MDAPMGQTLWQFAEQLPKPLELRLKFELHSLSDYVKENGITDDFALRVFGVPKDE